MKKIIIAAILIPILIIGCSKNVTPPIAEDYIIIRGLYFYLLDSLGNNLIGLNGQKFNSDSIKIYVGINNDPSKIGGTLGIDSLTGKYYCRVLYLAQPATTEEDINNIYINLPLYVYLNKDDTDTIEVKKNFNQNIRFYYNNIYWDSVAALNKNITVLTLKK
ncbi:MAG: hypothetical protein ACR2FN_07645 [Chitinophagaceae bacterium]